MDLIDIVVAKMEQEPTSYTVCYDLYQIGKAKLKEDVESALKWLTLCAEHCARVIPVLANTDLPLAKKFVGLHKQVLLAGAP